MIGLEDLFDFSDLWGAIFSDDDVADLINDRANDAISDAANNANTPNDNGFGKKIGTIIMLGTVVNTGLQVAAAKDRYQNAVRDRSSRAWADYSKGPDQALARMLPGFFNGNKLKFDQIMSPRISSLPPGRAMLLVEGCLWKAASNDKDAIPYLCAIFILRDYEGIEEAVRIIQKGPKAVVGKATFIADMKGLVKKGMSGRESLISAGRQMYPQIAEALDRLSD